MTCPEINSLKELDLQKTLFVGIGNVLKKDDGAGVYVTRQLEQYKGVRTLTVEVSIENYIGKINSLNPETLVLVDSVDLGREAGYYKLLPLEEIRDVTVNTHNISLNKVAELFEAERILVLGIQPQQLGFGEGLSRAVQSSADEVIRLILNNQ
ncbi:MAG: hydrogenase maturation protease [Bacteroidales bacterium]|nr:hydrogenase maturation protease [Bacteroidales bacterium]